MALFAISGLRASEECGPECCRAPSRLDSPPLEPGSNRTCSDCFRGAKGSRIEWASWQWWTSPTRIAGRNSRIRRAL